MKWQPIETAPEDTTILVFVEPDWVDTGFWVLDDSDDDGRRVWFWGGANRMHENHHPTHWMPLPNPPEEEPNP